MAHAPTDIDDRNIKKTKVCGKGYSGSMGTDKLPLFSLLMLSGLKDLDSFGYACSLAESSDDSVVGSQRHL